MAWGNSKSVAKKSPLPRHGQRTSRNGNTSETSELASSPPPTGFIEKRTQSEEHDATAKPPSAMRTPERTPRSACPSPPLSARPGAQPTGNSDDIAGSASSEEVVRQTSEYSNRPNENRKREREVSRERTRENDKDKDSVKDEPKKLRSSGREGGMRLRRLEPRDGAGKRDEQDEDDREAGNLLAGVIPRKDQICIRGDYIPWFHTRFMRAVPIPRKQRAADLKLILQMEKELGIDIVTKPRPVREKRPKKSMEEDDDDDDDEELEEETWVGCDKCQKWRRVVAGTKIDLRQSFHCSMIPGMSCKVKEESWENSDDWEEQESKNKGSSVQDRSERGEKRRAIADLQEGEDVKRKERRVVRKGKVANDEPGSPQDVTAGSSLYTSASPRLHEPASPAHMNSSANAGPASAAVAGYQGSSSSFAPSMSRLEAVIRVLRSTKKVMHYDALTKQALRMGLIRFSGSQGTAGESMKAFLNKIIRENRSNTIVNLGKGIYGLKEWIVEGGVVVDAGDNAEESKQSPSLTQHSGILNWNDFQHRYGGRGHSREQLHEMYLKTCGWGGPDSLNLPPSMGLPNLHSSNLSSPSNAGGLSGGGAKTHAEALQSGVGTFTLPVPSGFGGSLMGVGDVTADMFARVRQQQQQQQHQHLQSDRLSSVSLLAAHLSSNTSASCASTSSLLSGTGTGGMGLASLLN